MSRFLLLKKNYLRINFWDLTATEAKNRVKNADLSEKSVQLWLSDKFIIAMTNNKPKTILNNKGTAKNKERSEQYYEDSKEKLHKMNQGQYRGLSEERKKWKKEKAQEIGTEIPEEDTWRR